METKKIKNVLDYLYYIENGGIKLKSWRQYARDYKLPGKNPEDNARKIWKRFKQSGLSALEYANKYYKEYLVLSDVYKKVTDEKEWVESEDNAVCNLTTELKDEPTLEKAIELSGADMDVWEVKNWRWGYSDVHMKLRTPVLSGNNKDVYSEKVVGKRNYNIRIEFKLKEIDEQEYINSLIEDALKVIPKIKSNKKIKGSGIGIFALADLHLGAEVTDLIKTPDFSIEILIKHLDKVADEINDKMYDEVHLFLLGDFFESLSGLNHLNTFKSLARHGYGGAIMKLGGVIFSNFLSKINNLVSVKAVAGNHDRITMKDDVDNEGAGAEILIHILQLKMPDIKFEFHPYLISTVIDDINYILTHGQMGMNGKPTADIIKTYGIDGYFTIWLEGHKHQRKSEKTWRKYPVWIEKFQVIDLDNADYRRYMVPSIFTGNYYSETAGFTTRGGFMEFVNKKYMLSVADHSL